jgi:hypothetical protein
MSDPMVKALEVSLDGTPLGLFVPPLGEPFAVFVGNIPRRYMRVQVVSGTRKESWSWQLPDVQEGQVLSLRMVEAKPGSGRPPASITPRETGLPAGPRRSSGRKRPTEGAKRLRRTK